MSATPLPEFANPPVVETVLGIQFDPLPQLTVFHLGAFWALLGDGWPTLIEVPPLGQAAEPTDRDDLWPGGGLEVPAAPSPALLRLRASNAAGDRGLQLENGWFVLNWRKTEAVYPRYDALRQQFDELFGRFQTFLARQGLGVLRPNLFEVSYINAIPKTPLWQDVTSWTDVLPGLLGPVRRTSAGSLQTVRGRWVFDLEENRGRLQVHLDHGRNDAEGEIVLLRLMARGPVSDSPASWGNGLDLGHEAVVRSFKELTSPAAHQHWRLGR